MLSKTQGYVPTLACYVRSTVPAAAAGATFAAVTCAATTLRKKDDKINYFLGGASAGGIFGFTGEFLMTQQAKCTHSYEVFSHHQ